MAETHKQPPLTEAQWQRQVTQLAELFGWTWAHFRPAMTSKGWRTPVSGPMGAGFPDLVLVRGGRLIFAELKRQAAVLSIDQQRVVTALSQVDEISAYVWRPADLDAIVEILR